MAMTHRRRATKKRARISAVDLESQQDRARCERPRPWSPRARSETSRAWIASLITATACSSGGGNPTPTTDSGRDSEAAVVVDGALSDASTTEGGGSEAGAPSTSCGAIENPFFSRGIAAWIAPTANNARAFATPSSEPGRGALGIASGDGEATIASVTGGRCPLAATGANSTVLVRVDAIDRSVWSGERPLSDPTWLRVEASKPDGSERVVLARVLLTEALERYGAELPAALRSGEVRVSATVEQPGRRVELGRFSLDVVTIASGADALLLNPVFSAGLIGFSTGVEDATRPVRMRTIAGRAGPLALLEPRAYARQTLRRTPTATVRFEAEVASAAVNGTVHVGLRRGATWIERTSCPITAGVLATCGATATVSPGDPPELWVGSNDTLVLVRRLGVQ